MITHSTLSSVLVSNEITYWSCIRRATRSPDANVFKKTWWKSCIIEKEKLERRKHSLNIHRPTRIILDELFIPLIVRDGLRTSMKLGNVVDEKIAILNEKQIVTKKIPPYRQTFQNSSFTLEYLSHALCSSSVSFINSAVLLCDWRISFFNWLNFTMVLSILSMRKIRYWGCFCFSKRWKRSYECWRRSMVDKVEKCGSPL